MDVIAIDHVVTTGGNCTEQGPCWYLNICPTEKALGVHAVCYEADCKMHDHPAVCHEAQMDKRVTVLNPWDSQGNQITDGTGIYPCIRGCGGGGYQQGYVLQHIDESAPVVIKTDHVPVVCMSERQISMMVTEDVSNSILQSDHKGCGWNEEEKMFTLNTIDRHAVCFPVESIGHDPGRGWWNQSDVAECIRTPCGGDSTKANIVACRVENNLEKE